MAKDTFYGKKIIILGLARQGKALARYAAENGAQVTVSDLRTAEALQEIISSLEGLGIEYVLGEHPMTLINGADYLVVSGGVPANIPLVNAAREQNIKITNDSQEFAVRTPGMHIGITGSAGKTTTTALTGAMGKASGKRTWVGGNIGQPLISNLDEMKPGDLIVQELSSFQLELWQHSPKIAAVLNITPNHLDRHKTMGVYKDAKANIVRFQDEDSVAVLAADDPESLSLASLAQGRVRLFSMEKEVDDGAFLKNDVIHLNNLSQKGIRVCSLDDIKLRGSHNIRNVCAAVTLADSAGIPVEGMRETIKGFKGVAHRLEVVATLEGVQYVNDSIATAPERAIAAIESFDEPLILLAGGKDKNMVWDGWVRLVQDRVKNVILFGHLGDMLSQRLSEGVNAEENQAQLSITADLDEAVNLAAAVANPGDIVLLSPGGTSFDSYVDFAARGQHFRDLVQDLVSKQTNNGNGLR